MVDTSGTVMLGYIVFKTYRPYERKGVKPKRQTGILLNAKVVDGKQSCTVYEYPLTNF